MLDFPRKMAVDGIPVVDFSAMSLENKNPLSEDDPTIRDLADQVHQAFSTIGFVYLRNHGIPQEMVGGLFIKLISDRGYLRGYHPSLVSQFLFLLRGIMWLKSLLYLLKLQLYLFSRSLKARFDIQGPLQGNFTPSPRPGIKYVPINVKPAGEGGGVGEEAGHRAGIESIALARVLL